MNGDPRNALVSAIATEYGRQLSQFFAARFPPGGDAQDLVQEVYVRLLKLGRPELIRCPKAYVYRVAASIAREHWLKRASRAPHVQFDELAEDTTTHADQDVATQVECWDEVLALLKPLSPRLRAAVIWAHRDGHTYEEISARLAVSASQVKKYLIRAMAECRKRALATA
jgi:RNA polymerase sigma-70 factor (ECF subfamily)